MRTAGVRDVPDCMQGSKLPKEPFVSGSVCYSILMTGKLSWQGSGWDSQLCILKSLCCLSACAQTSDDMLVGPSRYVRLKSFVLLLEQGCAPASFLGSDVRILPWLLQGPGKRVCAGVGEAVEEGQGEGSAAVSLPFLLFLLHW